MKRNRKNREKRERALEDYKRAKIKKANKNNEKQIWKAFLDTEEQDFKKYIGFGKEEIERIGISKFLCAIGFKSTNDIKKWRTDRFHLTICPDCHNDFGIYELYSVCNNCIKNYRTKEIDTALTANTQSGYLAADFYQMFYMSKIVRDSFKINSAEGKKCLYLRLIEDPKNITVILPEDVKVGDTVQFVMNDLTIYSENECTCFKIIEKSSDNDHILDINFIKDEDMERQMSEDRKIYANVLNDN